MKSPLVGRLEGHRFRLLLVCVAASGAILWLAARYGTHKPQPKPFRFPTAELAAIDRDLQVRFAVVPNKDFGIERTYGNQHYLYDPQTPAELATVATLRKQHTEVAFYLMSRALWLRSWDGWGYKPIQGPVILTGKLNAPLPRRVNFDIGAPSENRIEKVIDQDNGYGADTEGTKGSISTHNPAGRTVPSPVPPRAAPSFNQLQAIGNRVFEMVESSPKTKALGEVETLNSKWKVVAVPIRASRKECLPCHVYSPYPQNPNAPQQTKAQLGDALGVAFYLYSTSDKRLTAPNAQGRQFVK